MTVTLLIVNGNTVVSRATGRPMTVQDKPKLEQDINRLLSIARQSNGEGADLDALMGPIPSSPFALSSKVQRNVRQAITVLQAIQTQYQFGSRSAAELLQKIAQMFVFPAANDNGDQSRTSYYLRVDTQSAAGALISSTLLLSPPGL